jgi:RNA polymerase sigma-70 factor (ECF subfamily)
VTVDPEQISLAFLALLERLSPLERAAYVLAEAFDFDHAEIAAALGRAEPAVRQLLHRAREHVRAGRPRFTATATDHERVLGAFMSACAVGDVGALARLLAKDAVALSDGGGKARAALRPVVGPDRVARLVVGLARKAPPDVALALREFNGTPALVFTLGGRPYMVLQLETDGVEVRTVASVINPDKLRHVG